MNFFADPLLNSYLYLGIVLAGICLAILAILSPVILRLYRRNRAVRQLAEAFQASTTESFFGTSARLDLRYGGHSVIMRLHDAVIFRRFDRNSFHVLIDVHSVVSYGVRLKTVETRVSNWLNLSRGIETGVAELDTRYAFTSSEPERFARWVMLSAVVQDAFNALIGDRGVDDLVQEHGFLDATMVNYSFEQVRVEYVRGVLYLLSVLAQAGEKI